MNWCDVLEMEFDHMLAGKSYKKPITRVGLSSWWSSSYEDDGVAL